VNQSLLGFVLVEMIRIETESDPHVLRQVARLLESENNRLQEMVFRLRRELAELKGEEAPSLQAQIEGLEQLLAQREQELFGRSSEKRDRDEKPEGDEKPKAKPRGRSGRTEQPQLPVVAVVHELDEADRPCPKCGLRLEEMAGQSEDSEEITVVERRFEIRKHRRKKYRCRCNGHIETAEGPAKLMAGARYSIDFAIEVAVAKYLDHNPLERQVRIMEREGLDVTSQVLWGQIEALAKHLAPTHEAIRRSVLESDVIGADETWWRMWGKENPGKKRWYNWALSCPHAVYFEIAPARGAPVASKLLEGYCGIVMADGYGVYGSLAKSQPGIRLCNCWAHVRRKFFAVQSAFPVASKQILDLIDELFAIDAEAADGAVDRASLLERRRKLRGEKSRCVIANIQRWVYAQTTLPESGLGKAIAYMAALWTGLIVFLDDPAVPLDNNATERALRGPVVGRKNYYGARSRRGTEVAALFYSLFETAKLRGEEPKAYLRRAVMAAIAAPGTVTLPERLAEAA